MMRPGGRLVIVSMTKGEHWYNGLWETIYRIKPSWLGGCRGVALLPYVRAAGFESIKRVFISEMTFPSEVIFAVKPRVARAPHGPAGTAVR